MLDRRTYDVHTHVGLDQAFWMSGWWPYASTAQDLLECMAETQIDYAVCFPFCIPSAFDSNAFARDRRLELQSGRFPFDLENSSLLREVARIDSNGWLLPFAMFDPARNVSEQLSTLESLGDRIHGLKTQTTVLQSPITSLLDASSDLMYFAADHDLPVLLHTALLPEDRWAQVEDCLLVAEAYPEVRFNLAHSLRFHRKHLERAADLPNVWVDCSAHLAHCHLAYQNSPAVAPIEDRVSADYSHPTEAIEAVYKILGERYLWGSDNPFMSWCDDDSVLIYSYSQEVDVLRSLPNNVARSMSSEAPQAWLFGDRKGR